MKRYIIAILCLCLLAVSCEKREFALIMGCDINSYISADVYGTYRNYNGLRFASDAGVYKSCDHPEIRRHEDGTFSFKLDRRLTAKNDDDIHICFYWDREDNEFELGRVYSLTLLGDARADIELYERCTKDSGYGFEITYYEETTYEAVNGWIIFNSRRPYDDGMLFSGEFRFEGRAEDGSEVLIDRGKFKDCRICWANDYCCSDF